MIQAVIYDMDGLLIDSEPFWREAEQAIFKKVGINLTDDMCRQTMGLRVDEVVNYWYEKMPWQNISLEAVEGEIADKVIELILKRGALMPGITASLELLKSLGMKLAIGTSSKYNIVNAVLERCNIKNYFDTIHSAQEEIHGKPHPAVFINTAKKLGIAPQNCLVFEDSFHGVVAALAANMKVIAIPDEQMRKEKRFYAAHKLLHSMHDFKASHLQEI